MSDDDRVIFLDLDGVMAPHDTTDFALLAVAALRQLLADGRSRVVLISTWRADPDRRALAERQFAAADIPILGWVDESVPGKGHAMAAWLYDQFGAEADWPRVMVVDDHATADWLPGATVVVPDGRVGLTAADVKTNTRIAG